MPALILNPDAWPAQLHVDANQAKRLGRAWHPFTNIFDPGSRNAGTSTRRSPSWTGQLMLDADGREVHSASRPPSATPRELRPPDFREIRKCSAKPPARRGLSLPLSYFANRTVEDGFDVGENGYLPRLCQSGSGRDEAAPSGMR
jgi:hypothetical protein